MPSPLPARLPTPNSVPDQSTRPTRCILFITKPALLDVRVTLRPYPGYHLPEKTVLRLSSPATDISILVVRGLEQVIRHDKKSDQKNRVIKVKDIHIHHPSLLNILKKRGADILSAP